MAKPQNTPPFSNTLFRVIKKHRAAHEAFMNDAEDDRALHAEHDGRWRIALWRFKDDAEFLEALKYLLTTEAQMYGRVDVGDEFSSIIAAVARYFDIPVTCNGEPFA
jgi:hypothetical protein